MLQTNQHRRESGFSLIELIVTLAIAGILVAMAVPSYSNFVERSARTNTFEALRRAFAYAKSEAVSRLENVYVCPVDDANIDQPTCQTDWSSNAFVVAVDSNDDAVQEPSFLTTDYDVAAPTRDQILKVFEMKPFKTLTLTANGTAGGAFNNDGALSDVFPPGGATTITMTLCFDNETDGIMLSILASGIAYKSDITTCP